VGFIKKACIADNLAGVVDEVYAMPGEYSAASVVIATVFFVVQLYCDFSGYTDMAIATARLLGFKLPANFAFPYFATNPVQFWRRWHISLSSWIRDYLYIPLGGNRGSTAFHVRNLMIAMVLAGLWHGAAWNFAIWGALHGALLSARVVLRSAFPGATDRVPDPVGMLFTFSFWTFSMLFFRAETLADAGALLGALIGGSGRSVDASLALWIVPLALAHWLAYRRTFSDWIARAPNWLYALAYATIAVHALAFMPMEHRPFIYFQF